MSICSSDLMVPKKNGPSTGTAEKHEAPLGASLETDR